MKRSVRAFQPCNLTLVRMRPTLLENIDLILPSAYQSVRGGR
jgi:hypothetical protein